MSAYQSAKLFARSRGNEQSEWKTAVIAIHADPLRCLSLISIASVASSNNAAPWGLSFCIFRFFSLSVVFLSLPLSSPPSLPLNRTRCLSYVAPVVSRRGCQQITCVINLCHEKPLRDEASSSRREATLGRSLPLRVSRLDVPSNMSWVARMIFMESIP